ncbi:MAG TPA: MFS transporter [Bacteroidota bacterium]|jgi:MFS family permease
MNEPEAKISSWKASLSPLSQPLFRALWIASIVSNIGTWMQEVGEGWLMTTLTTSPALVGLLETAVTLPMFLFSLPAGALADILDRRRILIFTQIWMLVAAALLGVLALTGGVTPGVLLLLSFFLSIGGAINGPAWQASIPDIVPKPELSSAIALGSVGFNLARAVGPALGGLVIAASGPWAAFILNAVSFLAVIVVLIRWRREHHESILPAERVMGAMRAGLRYVRFSPVLQSVLVRTGAFMIFASAMWATLPFIARHEMGLSAFQYGMLIGSFGTGAIAGAGVLASLRTRISIDAVVRVSTLCFAALILTLAFVRSFFPVAAAMFVGGMGWMSMMSSLTTAAMLASPSWVRARSMSLYILVFMGCFAAGGALWGFAGSHFGMSSTLSIAAFGLIAGLAATLRYRLASDGKVDLTPSMHWPAPEGVFEPHPDDGPVMITVDYRIKPENAPGFSAAIHALGKVRRRDGAIQWGVFTDLEDPEKHVETFIVESWAEHLRQHDRVTMADREVELKAQSFHSGPAVPEVRHLIYSSEDPPTGS